MGKKVKSNRGYATASIPSKQIAEEVKPSTAVLDVPQLAIASKASSPKYKGKQSHATQTASITRKGHPDVAQDDSPSDDPSSFYITVLKSFQKDLRLSTIDADLRRAKPSSLFELSLSRHQETILLQALGQLNPILAPAAPFPCTPFTTHVPVPETAKALLGSPPQFLLQLNYVHTYLEKLGFARKVIPFLLSHSAQPWDLNETLHFACLVLPSEQLPTRWADKNYYHFTSLAIKPQRTREIAKSATPEKPEVLALPESAPEEEVRLNFDALDIFDLDLPSPSSFDMPETQSFSLQGWTGKTPEQLLRDLSMKENRNAKVSFTELPVSVGSAYQFSCKINDQVYMPNAFCSNKLEARNYVATVALYQRAKGRPLYKVLPPSYREIWFALEKKEKSDAMDFQFQLDKDRIVLFQSIHDQHGQTSSAPLVSTSSLNPRSFLHTVTSRSHHRKHVSQILRQPIGIDLQKARANLPVSAYATPFLQLLSKNNVILIQGATGSGKSTQIPQFILEFVLHPHEKIYCTQPRRISAISLAQRVTDEWGEKHIGQTIGYSVKFESSTSIDTKLVFCTTGVLLRILEQDSELCTIRYLIIDEVHERTVESDFLLVMVKQILLKRSDLTVILMSATLQGLSFSKYFPNCPVLNIPGKTFPVESFYLEDILELIPYSPDLRGQREIHFIEKTALDGTKYEVVETESFPDDDSPYVTAAITKKWKEIDPTVIHYDLIVDLVLHCMKTHAEPPSVLIFLPGLQEIKRLHARFSAVPEILALPLHSSLSTVQQHLVFKPPPEGKTKVILATNIAETGITIDDINLVIDTGKAKVTRYDPKLQLTRLEETFISVNNCIQRRGRAGRTKPGIYFAVFSRHRFESLMDRNETPEILRMPLESTILRMKLHGFEDLLATFSQFLDSPSKSQIRMAIQKLQSSRALDDQQQLTPLGHFLVLLPLDIELGRLIAFGAFYQCFQKALTVAAYLSSNVTLFESDEAKKRFLNKGDFPSDLLLYVNTYEAWCRAASSAQFCLDFKCSRKALIIMDETRALLHRTIQKQFGTDLDRFSRYGTTTLPMALLSACFPHACRAVMRTSHVSLVSVSGHPVAPHASSILNHFPIDTVYCYFKALLQGGTKLTVFDMTRVTPGMLLCLASLSPFQADYVNNQIQWDTNWPPIDIPSKTIAHLREFHYHLISAFENFILHPKEHEHKDIDKVVQTIHALFQERELLKSA